MSCEETLESSSATDFDQNHGYNFEVPIDTHPGTPTEPVALSHLGRFAHEAVAMDPATGAVDETEDQGDGSGFFRYVPSMRPTAAGRPGVVDRRVSDAEDRGRAPQYETAINQTVGVPLRVEWVNITDPDPDPVSVVVSGATLSAVFVEGLAAGSTRFRRLEGCWYATGERSIFISTNGGNSGFGQVWEYDIRRETLTLLVESPNHDVFDGPDNVCVSPSGGLVFCEDAGGAQHLRGVSRSGRRLPARAKSAQQHRVRRRLLQPGRQDAVCESRRWSTEWTTQPYRSPVQIPVGPERHERAATLAIRGPWWVWGHSKVLTF